MRPEPYTPKAEHVDRTPARPHGATLRQWGQAWNLGGKWLLPYVDDPPGDKAPQRIDPNTGAIYGYVSWQRERGLTLGDVKELSRDSRHGIGILCREIRAIDCDLKKPAEGVSWADHVALAKRIMSRVHAAVPGAPYRWRPTAEEALLGWQPDSPGSCSFVLLYRFAEDEADELMGNTTPILHKRTVITPAGNLEFSGDLNFQVLAGRHESGAPQLWRTQAGDGRDLPTYDDVPVISRARIDALIDELINLYPDPRHAVLARPPQLTASTTSPDDDPVIAFVERTNNDARWKHLRTGMYSCTCPNAANHSTPDKADTTVYMPEGLNGYVRGFKCQHAGCATLTVGDYLQFVGYTTHTAVTTFAALPAPVGPPPAPDQVPPPVRYNEAGTLVLPTQANVNNLLDPRNSKVFCSHDSFTAQSSYAYESDLEPRDFNDATTNEVYHYLVGNCKLDPKCPLTRVEQALILQVMAHTYSSAERALSKLTWDGVPRLHDWLARALDSRNTPYLSTLGTYMLTAIAGRLLEPGLKVDITPILYGPPGTRKSTLVSVLALQPEWAGVANLETRDRELQFQLLGKSVVEIAELRGFHTRDAEGIKAWLTTTADNFRIPYAKYSYDRPRQFVTIGTTNAYVFLTEDVTARRFAPVEVFRTINTEMVIQEREQLYAEAIQHFRLHGVPWADLEKLAEAETARVVINDPWGDVLDEWLTIAPARITLSSALSQAIGLSITRQSASQATRMAKLLRSRGYSQQTDNSWAIQKR